MLALAGATYQGVFRNPLADPYLLGVAAGAGLGATLAIVYGRRPPCGHDLIPLAAFVGRRVGVVVAYVLGRSAGGGADAATLILAGVTVASFLTAMQTFVQQQHADTLQEVYAGSSGGLDTAGWHDVALVLPYIVVSAVVILPAPAACSTCSASATRRRPASASTSAATRLLLVVAATLGTAAAVAVSGLIGFVGIIVPHAIRLARRRELPRRRCRSRCSSAAGFLVLADVIARTVLSPAELPIGVVTAFFGAPFFAIVLRRRAGASRERDRARRRLGHARRRGDRRRGVVRRRSRRASGSG